jgi:FMN phosphatase YigB (HAD superfamily)
MKDSSNSNSHSGAAGRTVISLDFCGTLSSCSFLDEFWFRALPAHYAKSAGIGFEEAKNRITRMYDSVGEEDVRWYLPDYWFGLLRLRAQDVFRDVAGAATIGDDVLGLLNELRGRRHLRVILSTNAPTDLITAVAPALPVDRIYSSTYDMKLVHKDESFWRGVIEGEGGPPMAHFGDDPIYDLRIPSSLGIRCTEVNALTLVPAVRAYLGLIWRGEARREGRPRIDPHQGS